MRPPLRPFIAMPKPQPSPPSMFSAGTLCTAMRSASTQRRRELLRGIVPTVGHDDGARGLRVPANLLLLGSKAEPRSVLVHNKAADAFGRAVTRARHDEVHVRGSATADERLCPVQHVLGSTPRCCCAQSSSIRSRSCKSKPTRANTIEVLEEETWRCTPTCDSDTCSACPLSLSLIANAITHT